MPFGWIASAGNPAPRLRISSDRLTRQNVVEVMLHVPDIIFDDEAEGSGFAVADCAHGGKFVGRNVLHEARKQRVVLKPESDKKVPRKVLIAVYSHPFLLFIARPSIPAFQGRSDKADMVVGG